MIRLSYVTVVISSEVSSNSPRRRSVELHKNHARTLRSFRTCVYHDADKILFNRSSGTRKRKQLPSIVIHSLSGILSLSLLRDILDPKTLHPRDLRSPHISTAHFSITTCGCVNIERKERPAEHSLQASIITGRGSLQLSHPIQQSRHIITKCSRLPLVMWTVREMATAPLLYKSHRPRNSLYFSCLSLMAGSALQSHKPRYVSPRFPARPDGCLALQRWENGSYGHLLKSLQPHQYPVERALLSWLLTER